MSLRLADNVPGWQLQRAGLGWLRLGGILLAAAYLLVLLAHPLGLVQGQLNNHYLYLAAALREGRLSVDNLPASLFDQVAYNGHTYLPFGPFPAVLLIPFQLVFGYQVHSAVLSLPLTALTAWLLWRIFAALGVAVDTRVGLLLAFIFGSSYTFVATRDGPWFLAQLTVVAAICAALWLVLRKPLAEVGGLTWLAVGLLLAAALLARFTAGLAAIFFVSYLLLLARRERWSLRRLLPPLAGLGAGLTVGVVVYFAYNYLRFGSISESGFSYARVPGEQLRQTLAYGLYSPSHIPTNFYYMFLKGPDAWPNEVAPVLAFPWFVPSPLGMSILLLTPLLVYVVRASWREPLVAACWAAILPTLAIILCYYGVGQIQVGYRYTLDFLPFAFVLLAVVLRAGLSTTARWLIGLGCAVTVWGNAVVDIMPPRLLA